MIYFETVSPIYSKSFQKFWNKFSRAMQKRNVDF